VSWDYRFTERAIKQLGKLGPQASQRVIAFLDERNDIATLKAPYSSWHPSPLRFAETRDHWVSTGVLFHPTGGIARRSIKKVIEEPRGKTAGNVLADSELRGSSPVRQSPARRPWRILALSSRRLSRSLPDKRRRTHRSSRQSRQPQRHLPMKTGRLGRLLTRHKFQ